MRHHGNSNTGFWVLVRSGVVMFHVEHVSALFLWGNRLVNHRDGMVFFSNFVVSVMDAWGAMGPHALSH